MEQVGKVKRRLGQKSRKDLWVRLELSERTGSFRLLQERLELPFSFLYF